MEDSVSPYNVPLDRGGIGGSDRESSKTCGIDCGVSAMNIAGLNVWPVDATRRTVSSVEATGKSGANTLDAMVS